MRSDGLCLEPRRVCVDEKEYERLGIREPGKGSNAGKAAGSSRNVEDEVRQRRAKKCIFKPFQAVFSGNPKKFPSAETAKAAAAGSLKACAADYEKKLVRHAKSNPKCGVRVEHLKKKGFDQVCRFEGYAVGEKKTAAKAPSSKATASKKIVAGAWAASRCKLEYSAEDNDFAVQCEDAVKKPDWVARARKRGTPTLEEKPAEEERKTEGFKVPYRAKVHVTSQCDPCEKAKALAGGWWDVTTGHSPNGKYPFGFRDGTPLAQKSLVATYEKLEEKYTSHYTLYERLNPNWRAKILDPNFKGHYAGMPADGNGAMAQVDATVPESEIATGLTKRFFALKEAGQLDGIDYGAFLQRQAPMKTACTGAGCRGSIRLCNGRDCSGGYYRKTCGVSGCGVKKSYSPESNDSTSSSLVAVPTMRRRVPFLLMDF